MDCWSEPTDLAASTTSLTKICEMSSPEVERFEITDEDLQNEFNPHRKQFRMSKNKATYGKCVAWTLQSLLTLLSRVGMLGAICGSAQSMDCAAQSVDPYIAQESMDCAGICGSRLLARSAGSTHRSATYRSTQHPLAPLLNLYAYNLLP